MHPLSRLASVVLIGATGLLSLSVQAEEARYNQISLSTQVNREVAHDLMLVTLYSEAQNSDPATLAAEVTRTLNAALARARAVKGVTVSLGSRNSYPVYDDEGSIDTWRERAEIRLESADFTALSKLTGEMLKNLKMDSMSFGIATATRKQQEEGLVKEAVDAFRARAQLATNALGGGSYKLVSLNLNSGGFQQPLQVRQQVMRASSFSSASDTVTPDIEAGTSQVTVSAEGVIEVQMR